MLTHLFHGFSLALADSVPGVSGGTVAFILGFYERFINALHDVFSKDGAQRKQALVYLCKLGVGWVAGMSVSVMLLAKALDSNIYFLSLLFMGLTAASIPFIVVEERKTLAGGYGRLIYTLLGAALGVGLSIHFIRAAFRKHRAAMLYLVFGMMLGSLYAIAMGPATLSIPQPPMSPSAFSLPGFLLGAIILVGLEGTKLFTTPAQETQTKKPLPLPAGQGVQNRRI